LVDDAAAAAAGALPARICREDGKESREKQKVGFDEEDDEKGHLLLTVVVAERKTGNLDSQDH
jgi:hypothetical protein